MIKNVSDAFKEILKTEGIRGLYRGYGATFIAFAPSSAIWWGSYATVKNIVSHYLPQYRHLPNVTSFYDFDWKHFIVNGLTGSTAGVFTSFITNPLDVAKTRLQVKIRI